jgi:hypothetical protein
MGVDTAPHPTGTAPAARQKLQAQLLAAAGEWHVQLQRLADHLEALHSHTTALVHASADRLAELLCSMGRDGVSSLWAWEDGSRPSVATGVLRQVLGSQHELVSRLMLLAAMLRQRCERMAL